MVQASTCLCRVTSDTYHRIEDNSAEDMHSLTAGIDCGRHASSQSTRPVYTCVGRTLLSCSSLACLRIQLACDSLQSLQLSLFV